MKALEGDILEYFEPSVIELIARIMKMKAGDIKDVHLMKKGMTNRSFIFTAYGQRYIIRIPGEGTDKLIDRENEYHVYKAIKDYDLSDEVVYISEKSGYKVTKFLENARNCDPNNPEDVKKCIKMLRDFHEKGLEVDHGFDLFEKIQYYESLWEGRPSIFDDYEDTKRKILDLSPIIDSLPKKLSLTHIDPVPDNFLITRDKIRLIDWEYSSMQDPHLDIAMFGIYSKYNKQEMDKLIDLYFDGDCQEEVRIKIYAYIAASSFLWSNWCEYKRFCGVEFGEYSYRQYENAKKYYLITMDEYRRLVTN